MSRLKYLPKNQLADLLISVGTAMREMKSGQAVPASGLMFYETGNSGEWDYNGTATTAGGQQIARYVVFTVTATATTSDIVLLADLIVDKAIIDGQTIDRVHILATRVADTKKKRWHILMFPQNSGTVNVKLKCLVAANAWASVEVVEGRL